MIRRSFFYILFINCICVYARQPMKDLPAYHCVHYDRNVLHFPAGKDAQNMLYDKLDSVLLFGHGRVNIWHVGGSHVQADYFTHRMRCNLIGLQPNKQAVRGVLFPYAMAKTNYNPNYRVDYTGRWNCNKNVKHNTSFNLGLTGMAATTSDTAASFTLHLNMDEQPVWQFSRLRVLGYASSDSIYPCLISRSDTICARKDSQSHSYVLDLGYLTDSATVYLHLEDGGSFTLTGLIPDNDLQGISYFSSGVNGAAVPAWLRCNCLEEELQLIKPDLVLLGIGINDAAVPYGRFDTEAFKANYRTLINRIRSVSPQCALLFITNNDSYRYVSRRRMAPNANGRLVQKAFYDLAEEYDAGVWDLFDIMGGYGSVDAWEDEGLVRRDRIHFTRMGYELLGDLLYNALMADYLFDNER